MTKGELIRILTENYANVPDDAEVVVPITCDTYRYAKPRVTEHFFGREPRSVIVIAPEDL